MTKQASLFRAVIELQITEREAELEKLRSWIGKMSLPFDDFLEAMNALAMLEDEVMRWTKLRDAIQPP